MDKVDQKVQMEWAKYEFCLALLLTVERVTRNNQHQTSQQGKRATSEAAQTIGRQSYLGEDLVNLSETLLYCIREDRSVFEPQGLDQCAIIDRLVFFL